MLSPCGNDDHSGIVHFPIGKTNVALLCVLHEIKQHVPADIKGAVIPGSVSADMFKVGDASIVHLMVQVADCAVGCLCRPNESVSSGDCRQVFTRAVVS